MSTNNKQQIAISLLVSFIVSSVVGFFSGGYAYDYARDKELLPARLSSVGAVNPEVETTKVLKEDSAVIDVVKNSSPAVGNIIVTKDLPKVDSGVFNPFDPFGGDAFDFFNPFRRQPIVKEPETEKQEVGGGSGFIVSKDGLVVTNKHVADDLTAEYTFLTNDGQRLPAKVLAQHPNHDLAILRIEGKDFSYLSLGDSDNIQIGQSVVAIGNALGEFSNTVSTGVISGLSRSIIAQDGMGGSEKLNDIIQTDAAINQGNSGGPLLDLSGNVIGINTAVAEGAENIGFAIPVNTIKKSIKDVQEKGKIVQPFIGVRYMIINESIKQKNNLSIDYGALVVNGPTPEDLAVLPDSPADKAGIVINDIILEVNGSRVDSRNSLIDIISRYSVGDTVNLKVLSKGKEKTVSVVLEEME